MGWKASSTHVRRSTQAAVATALTGIVRERALVTRSRGGWVTFYDAASERSFAEGKRIASKLSGRLQTVVVHFEVFDSDILQYAIFDRGRLVDQFDSCPSYFAPAEPGYARRTRGRARALAKYARGRVSETKLESLLVRESSVFSAEEEERLRLLSRVFGIVPSRADKVYSDMIRARVPSAIGLESKRSARKASPADVRALASVQLRNAIGRGEIEAVRRLMAGAADPNAVDGHGRSLLLCAVYNPNASVDLVALLLDAGARVDQQLDVEFIGFGRHRPNWTALHYAVLIAPVEVVELLLSRGASVDAPGADGRTPLMTAAFEGRADVVERLVNAGAEVRLADKSGRSAVDWANEGIRLRGKRTGAMEILRLLGRHRD